MTPRTQAIVLGSLLVVLVPSGYYFYRGFAPKGTATPPAKLDEKFVPLDVDNPALRL